MAKITGTKEELLDAHTELQQFQRYQPTIATMLGERIKNFYRANDTVLKSAHERRFKIYSKYCQPSEDGKSFKMAKLKPEDPHETVVMLEPTMEGLSEETRQEFLTKQREAFNKELDAFLAEAVTYTV